MYIKEILQLKKYNYLNEIATFSNCVSHICNKIIQSIKIIEIPIFFTRLKKGIITLTNNKREREKKVAKDAHDLVTAHPSPGIHAERILLRINEHPLGRR